jgi:hypothetical protein
VYVIAGADQGNPRKGETMEDKERLVVVLKHLIEHNEGHGEDYKRWIDLAKGAGLERVANKIDEAYTLIHHAGDALKEALLLITE